MNDMEMIDVSESINKDVKKKDKFMTYIYISLVDQIVNPELNKDLIYS